MAKICLLRIIAISAVKIPRIRPPIVAAIGTALRIPPLYPGSFGGMSGYEPWSYAAPNAGKERRERFAEYAWAPLMICAPPSLVHVGDAKSSTAEVNGNPPRRRYDARCPRDRLRWSQRP